MSGKEIGMRSQTGIHAPLFHSNDPRNNPFTYKMWSTVNHHWRSWKLVDPDQNTSNNAIFTLQKDTDRNGIMTLEWTWSALTHSGSGNYLRLCDYAPIYKIDRIEILYGSKSIQTIPAETIHHRILREPHYAKRVGADQRIDSNKSPLERSILAMSSRKVILHIPTFWSECIDKYIPVNALADTIKIKVYWNNDNTLIQTDYTDGEATLTMSDLKLRINDVEHTALDRREMLDRTLTANGIIYKTWTYETDKEHTIPSGLAAGVYHSVELKSIKNSVYELYFVVRKKAEAGSDPTLVDPSNLQLVSAWSFLASNKELIDEQDDKFTRLMDSDIYYDGVPGAPIYGFTPSLDPMSSGKHCTGSFTLANTHKPTLKIKFDSTLTEDYLVDVYAKIHQNVQCVGGRLMETFK